MKYSVMWKVTTLWIFCLVIEATNGVNTTRYEVDHTLWVEYQQSGGVSREGSATNNASPSSICYVYLFFLRTTLSM